MWSSPLAVATRWPSPRARTSATFCARAARLTGFWQYQPVDGRPGGQVTSGRDSMEAVARKLLGRDITPDLAACCALAQQIPDEITEFFWCFCLCCLGWCLWCCCCDINA